MALPSAALALRESFGDRKLDISRKITACVTCRKLKIKCHMLESKPPCTRCRARDLPCKVNKSLQTLLESDVSWKEEMEKRIEKIEKALGQSSATSSELVDGQMGTVRGLADQGMEGPASTLETQTASNVALNLSCSLGAFPASSMTNATLTEENESSTHRPDLISTCCVSVDKAEQYLGFYKRYMDPAMHHVLAEEVTLADVRLRSCLLTAAICTVAAFCTGSDDYHTCYEAFKAEVSRKMFVEKHDFDDVRALCIGAFWLSDIAAALNGLAVRIGTQLDLHRCITKMPHTKRACYDRTRLYFLVYLCDHHCSLIYGRPPMTREFRSLRSPGLFLQSEFSTGSDLNLISQVEYWSISRRVFEHFGADIERNVADQRSADLRRLSEAYDRWHQDWSDVITPKHGKPRRVFDLYFHSGKLYLFSHVFRGSSQALPPAGSIAISGYAIQAVESALSIVRCITEANEPGHWLEKLPSYFGTMIAFACVCLIRSALQAPSIDDSRKDEILQHLHQLASLLRQSFIAESPAHPLLSIAKSLEAATAGRTQAMPDHSQAPSDVFLNFDFDAFANDITDLNFPGAEDFWMLCPDEMPSG